MIGIIYLEVVNLPFNYVHWENWTLQVGKGNEHWMKSCQLLIMQMSIPAEELFSNLFVLRIANLSPQLCLKQMKLDLYNFFSVDICS